MGPKALLGHLGEGSDFVELFKPFKKTLGLVTCKRPRVFAIVGIVTIMAETKLLEKNREIARMLSAFRAGEEQRRQTGRSTRIAHEIVDFVFRVKEPAVVISATEQGTRMIIEQVNDLLAKSVQEPERYQALVTGCGHRNRQSLRGRNVQIFEDHTVWMLKIEEAIRSL